MKRYAMVVVVEAAGPVTAKQEVTMALAPSGEEWRYAMEPAYVGPACPVAPADEYVTESIHLLVDGEVEITVPAPEAGDMSTSDGLGA